MKAKASPHDRPAISQSDVLAARVATAIDYEAQHDGTTPDQVISCLFNYVADPILRTDLTAQKRGQYERGTRLLQTRRLITSADADRIRRTDAPLIQVDRLPNGLYMFATLWPIEEHP